MALRLLLLICLLLPLAGCKKSDPLKSPEATDRRPVLAQPDTPATPLSAPPFLSQPLDTTVIESTNEALPIWRKFAKHRPLLVIVAQNPSLTPLPAEKRTPARNLLASADDPALRAGSDLFNPDPVLLPPMSASAALDAGWFTGIIWIFPTTATTDGFNFDRFRSQLIEAGIATPNEAEGLLASDGRLRGTVRGVPFIAAPITALPHLDQPALLHIDLNYFKPLYKGEIKTPLLGLLYETLSALRDAKLQIIEGTIALSHLDSSLPLQTRFFGQDLKEILTHPAMLGQPIPAAWQERAEALYLENFLQRQKIFDIYCKLERSAMTDPSLKYALFQAARELDRGDEALSYLHQAVQLDPVYALEYLALAGLAQEKNRQDKSIEMLTLARRARPHDPYILIALTQACLAAGDRQRARELATDLDKLAWSATYYPNMARATKELLALAKQ